MSSTETDRPRSTVLGCALGVAALALTSHLPPASASTLPQGFQETVVFSGLTQPTAVRFASDGRVFVAEKSGIIKLFPSLTSTTPTVFADLRTNVHNFWDRGLLGLAALGDGRRNLGRLPDPPRPDDRRLRRGGTAFPAAGHG